MRGAGLARFEHGGARRTVGAPMRLLGSLPLMLLVPLVVVAVGCGGKSQPRVVPEVRGARLDIAESRLDRAGLEYETSGGGTFGVVVRSNWWVCNQDPRAGTTDTSVMLEVARECIWRVPTVIGLRLDEARQTIGEVGIPYTTSGPAAPARSLEVCEQDPDPRYDETDARSLRIVVARTCSLPDVVGMRLTAAAQILRREGVAYLAERPDGGRPLVESRWIVCGQDPPAGDQANSVSLSVSKRCAFPVSAPQVETWTLADAKETLVTAGLAYRVVAPAGHRPTVPELWTVCDQDPEVGTEATIVTLFVARDCYAAWPERLED